MNKVTLYTFVSVLLTVFFTFLFIVLSFFIEINFVLHGLQILMFAFIILVVVFLFQVVYVVPKKKRLIVLYEPPVNCMLTVVLTAYNDEKSVSDSIKDFLSHPLVKRVIVISNNSKDKTIENAEKAGALAVNEEKQGYGACVYRALSEGLKYEDTELTVLCEGDMTFRAYDIDKFMSYIPHADIVNGTRIVEQLRNKNTQLSSFMYYGNFFAGKLLELKYISIGTFTDVGTTYKLCRNSALQKLLPILDNNINLEFNPYFMDVALKNNISIVECPVTFHPRVGISKGGNINNWVAFKLGLKMIKGILFKW
jgi:glycosyltransferase involved in cell wall biosynthesis